MISRCHLEPAVASRIARHKRLLRISAHSVSAVVIVLSLTGCLKEILFLGLLLHGPPSIEPEFDIRTGKSMTDRGVKVAVLCEAPSNLRLDFGKIDEHLGRYVTNWLARNKINCVHSEGIRAWVDEHPEFDTPEELGADLEVTYVIHIELRQYSLYEKNSQSLFRGSAEGLIKVYDMQPDGRGRVIYNNSFRYRYPRIQARSIYDIPEANFKREYLSRLSDQIGHHFYEWHTGDDIPDAT